MLDDKFTRRWLSLFFLTVSMIGAGKDYVFVRTCQILSRPAIDAPTVCVRRSGDDISRMRVHDASFLQLQSGSCVGYVPNSCISVQERNYIRAPMSLRQPALASRARVGLVLQGDGLFGKVEGASNSSKGLGYAAGFLLIVPLGQSLRVAIRPSLQLLSLTRSLDGTGVIEDPSPTSYTHRIPCVNLGLLANIALNRSDSVLGGKPEVRWWADVGAEYIYPLRSRQISSLGNELGFTPSDRPVLVVLGISGDYPLTTALEILGMFHGYYNVAATSGSRLLGLRLGLALSVSL